MSAAGSDQHRTYVGKYQILKHIATGGMGAVYHALDTDNNREVALKVLPPDQAARPTTRERLRREAAHGSKLNHENIVALYEFGDAQGTWYLAMEYVPGIDLFDQIDRHGPLPPEQARVLLTQMAAALDHIHEQGYIHRDIKSSNILLTRKDGQVVAKLADFGLVRTTADEEHRLTRDGCTVGTVDYLAPEQARDGNAADIRSDIYALGCTFFEMLTGKPPFPDGTLTERLFKHAEVEPPDVRNANPRIPADLAAICRRMLAKKPADRYQTPAELTAELLHMGPVSPKKNERQALRGARPDVEPEVSATGEERSQKARGASPVPHRSAGQIELARKALAAGNHRYGLQLLRDCCRMDPTNTDVRAALREAEEPRRAVRPAWANCLRARWYKLLLQGAKLLGKPAQVLEYGEGALASDPTDLDVHLWLAEAALALRQWSLTHWFLEQAQKGRGQHRLIHRALALLWEQKGDVKQAMACWELVDKIEPGNGEARTHLNDLSARHTLGRSHFQSRLETPS